MAYIKDTIAAIATAPGKGGVGIVRISGPVAVWIRKIKDTVWDGIVSVDVVQDLAMLARLCVQSFNVLKL